jgi:hypothetical protein
VSGLGLSALAAVAATAAALTGAAATGSLAGGHGAAPAGFTLRGHVSGLYPGARRSLVIAVHNPGRRPLRVRSISTSVRPARRGCGAENVRVARFRGRLRVGPGATRRVRVTARMPLSSPTACQGAVFPLVFQGRATR